jgi:hypothetical protein
MTANEKSIAWVGLDQSYSGFGIVIIDQFGTESLLWKFPPTDSDGSRLGEIYVSLVTIFTR